MWLWEIFAYLHFPAALLNNKNHIKKFEWIFLFFILLFFRWKKNINNNLFIFQMEANWSVSQLKVLILRRILVDDCNILLFFIPVKCFTSSIKSPALWEGSENSTPESTVEPPYSEFISKQSNVSALGTHLDDGVFTGFLIFQRDCPPSRRGS